MPCHYPLAVSSHPVRQRFCTHQLLIMLLGCWLLLFPLPCVPLSSTVSLSNHPLWAAIFLGLLHVEAGSTGSTCQIPLPAPPDLWESLQRRLLWRPLSYSAVSQPAVYQPLRSLVNKTKSLQTAWQESADLFSSIWLFIHLFFCRVV